MTRRDAECVQVSMYWKLWPVVFPQHGPGVKHARAIRLAAWQEAIVERERHAFLQGLIHSDGWRCVAQERTRRAVRYGFSNLSEDIKDLFCASCDAIGVRWTRTDRQVTVARAASVAILEEIVGPKS
jgi:hypothetical protein